MTLLDKRWIGRWLLGVATIHTIFGVVVFWDAVTDIVGAGLIYTIKLHSPHFGGYFFLSWGFLCYVLAFAVDELEKRQVKPFPQTVAYSLAVFTVISIAISPASGFWTLIPPSLGALMKCWKR
jgi:hypothetical protein